MITLFISLFIVVASLAADAAGAILSRIRPLGTVQQAPATVPKPDRPPRTDPSRTDADRQKALDSIAYYDTQLSRLYELIDAAKLDLIAARRTVQLDSGQAVPDRIAAKHRAELDRSIRRVITLERTIYNMERGRETAERKI